MFFADIALRPARDDQGEDPDEPRGCVPRSYGCCSRGDESRLKAETWYPFGSLVPLRWCQVRPELARSAVTPGLCLLPVHDGEALLRVHRRPVLQARLHRAQGDVPQDNATGCDVHGGLPCGQRTPVVSHPADSIVLLVGQPVNRGDRERDRHRCAGTGHTRGNDWHADGLQEWIYGSFNTAMGLGTTGGKCRCRRRRQPRGLGWSVGYCSPS